MEKFKKNLPIILGSVACTLLLVITVILITNNGKFTFKNDTNNSDVNTNVKVKTDTKTETKEETKTNVNEKVETNTEVKSEVKTEVKTEVKETPVVEEKKTTTPVIENTNIDDEILSYFNQEEKNIDSATKNDGSLTSKLKTSFTTIIDFIFYDKEIKGHTFKELSHEAKLKVISIALSIDGKIDAYFPDYKDKIKDKYVSIKEKLSDKFTTFKSYLCEKVGSDACNQAKEDWENLKNTLSKLKEMSQPAIDKAKGAASKAKDAAVKAKDSISEAYQKWRDK